MAEVESIYYQVMIPDNQQAFLKCSWWNIGNLLEKPQDFMSICVFGGTSSASYSNYALRRTSIHNESIF